MFAKAAITGTLQAGTTAFDAEYLVVAGGGGGSVLHSGGGGAGGYRSSVTGESSGGGASAESALSIALGTPYTITVGAGGASVAVSYSAVSNKGTDSVFNTITSAGGGGGVLGTPDPPPNADGGSGGGGGAGGVATSPAGSGTANQGFNGGEGGNAGGSTYHGGGGGGAGQIGGNCIIGTRAGNAGNGVQSYITGSGIYRAGGGGGSSYAHPGGAAGLGGGGAGGGNAAGTAGTANTGGGGGAGGGGSAANVSGAGGSGVVIIRVPSTVVAEFSAGVVYNYIPTDDFNVYEITAAGVSDTVTFSQGAVTTVGESLLFNDNDGAYLSRTPASAGNRKTWTWSGWIKRGNLGGHQSFFSSATNNAQLFYFNEELRFFDSTSGTVFRTTALFRDPSAWYHVVISLDTTAATSSNRAKVFVNGKQVTDFAATAYPSLNADLGWNSTGTHYLARSSGGTYFDSYMSDVYFIDGEALDPSRFGKQDADGVWQPITYTGTYGTNGFHLDFADNSTAAALGTDVSGNGNNWTPSGITTDDQVTDTPSVNYATWNAVSIGADSTLSDGNLKIAYGSSATRNCTTSTTGMQSGKWYWEIEITASSTVNTNAIIGISSSSSASALPNYPGFNALGWGYYGGDGDKYHNSSAASYGAAYGVGDVIGVAFDADTGDLEFYKNNASQGVAYTGLTDGPYFPAIGDGSATTTFTAVANFGQRPFAYTPPTGFQALNSSNLPAPTITDGKEYFDTVLYTGNGASQTVRGLEFAPDFVWIKNRDVASTQHLWYDTIRGATNTLFSSSTSAEYSFSGLTSFEANGFAVGSQFPGNGAGNRIAAWAWNAGGSTVTNTDGTITSQVRANTDAGFSIVGWTGGGVAGTAGHGLNEAPEIYIYKNRSATTNWAAAYTIVDGSLDFMYLNLANAAGNAVQAVPTSSVIDLNVGAGDVNSGQAYIAYCFHSVDGFSKFGSYTGNGAGLDGPFIYTGFRPAFVIMKSNTNGYYWVMKDNKRAAAYNPATGNLYPNDLLLEDTAATANIDLLANGFKLRGNYLGTNGFGVGYIYMAFAENPFKTSRAR